MEKYKSVAANIPVFQPSSVWISWFYIKKQEQWDTICTG
jgi:hypothetical protein